MPDGETIPSPDRIFVDGFLKYIPGDPIPIDEARALGLVDEPKPAKATKETSVPAEPKPAESRPARTETRPRKTTARPKKAPPKP